MSSLVGHSVLIISLDIGSGHRSVAEVYAQMARDLGAKVTILNGPRELFGLCDVQGAIGHLGSLGAWNGIGLLKEHYFIGPQKGDLADELIDQAACRLRELGNPEIIISTYAFHAEMIARAALQVGRGCLQVATDKVQVTTDTLLEGTPSQNPWFFFGSWDTPDTLYDRTDHLPFHVRGDRVRQLGLAVRAPFLRQYDERGLKKKYGVGADKKVVVVCSGGLGTPFELPRPISGVKMFVLCGQNEELREQLDAKGVSAFGYVDGEVMAELFWLARTGCVLSFKVGGSTTAECLAIGVKVLFPKVIPLVYEVPNQALLIESGIGWEYEGDVTSAVRRVLLEGGGKYECRYPFITTERFMEVAKELLVGAKRGENPLQN
ncbi:MAG: hypothetical protein S4CHLAM102_16160 [Chlamydiia bacterium]|nr:hypothetical protein [Chlamydiia bacterium]